MNAQPDASDATDAKARIHLLIALMKARAAFPAIPKTRTATVQTRQGGSYKYAYADLSDVIAAVGPHLAANGLVVFHRFRDGADERRPVLETVLAHESGETLVSSLPILADMGPQELGSWITYARRYMVCALLGIVTDDDEDGQHAQDSRQGAAPVRSLPPRPTRARSPASGQPAQPTRVGDALPANVPRGTPAAPVQDGPPPEAAGQRFSAGDFWKEKVGWGKTTIHGKPISEMLWMEVIEKASVNGGRYGWLKSQVAFLQETAANEGDQYCRWARKQLPRVQAAMAEIEHQALTTGRT